MMVGLLLVGGLSACSSRRAEAPGPVAETVVSSAGVRIEGAELREGLPGVEDGVLYLTLRNTGDRVVRLVGGRTPVARGVVPMQDHAHHGADLDTTLAPGERLVFEPGGAHLMLTDLVRAPEVGEWIDVVLTFEPGGEVSLRVPVVSY